MEKDAAQANGLQNLSEKKKYHEYRNFIPGSKASLYEHSDFTFIRVFDPDADISLRAETKTTKFRLGLQFVT